MIRQIKYLLLTAVYLTVLTFLLLHPKFNGSSVFIVAHTLCAAESQAQNLVIMLHFIAFFILALCVSPLCTKKTILPCLVLLVCYAVGTEWLQEYIPPRAFRYDDLAQNIAGIVVGLFIGCYPRFAMQDISLEYSLKEDYYENNNRTKEEESQS
jgi:hypothetical protein